MEYLNAFLCGGLLCAVGQIILDKTSLTPARILTGYVVAGVLLQAVGVYQYIVDWGGAGATVPLTGFGYSLAKGVAKAVAEDGLLGVLTGGLTATSGGIAAAVVFSRLAALLVRPKDPGPVQGGRRHHDRCRCHLPLRQGPPGQQHPHRSLPAAGGGAGAGHRRVLHLPEAGRPGKAGRVSCKTSRRPHKTIPPATLHTPI